MSTECSNGEKNGVANPASHKTDIVDKGVAEGRQLFSPDDIDFVFPLGLESRKLDLADTCRLLDSNDRRAYVSDLPVNASEMTPSFLSRIFMS